MTDKCHHFPRAAVSHFWGALHINPVTINPVTRQDVPHEPVSKDFLNSAWVVIIFFFLPRGSLIFGIAKAPHHGHCEDAQY
jgi:hypothetical protein